MKHLASSHSAGGETLTCHVSTLWLLASNTGSYSGSLAGAAAYDWRGFQTASSIELLVLVIAVSMMLVFAVVSKIMAARKNDEELSMHMNTQNF